MSLYTGLPAQTLSELREIQSREKRKFDFADTDSDGQLTREELTLFLHPEESKRMTSYLVQVMIMFLRWLREPRLSQQIDENLLEIKTEF